MFPAVHTFVHASGLGSAGLYHVNYLDILFRLSLTRFWFLFSRSGSHGHRYYRILILFFEHISSGSKALLRVGHGLGGAYLFDAVLEPSDFLLFPIFSLAGRFVNAFHHV
jgi:hypothetical protein